MCSIVSWGLKLVFSLNKKFLGYQIFSLISFVPYLSALRCVIKNLTGSLVLSKTLAVIKCKKRDTYDVDWIIQQEFAVTRFADSITEKIPVARNPKVKSIVMIMAFRTRLLLP